MAGRTRVGVGIAAGSLALVLGLGTPAGAERPPRDDVVTEDTDTNDGVPNNVVDEGDNRHPSGRDRSVEAGGSGNQGNSASDPDGEANGGPDKPGGAGGVDLADQDGNNGCGNDDDFEDDNNGNCGGHRVPDETPSIAEVDDDVASIAPAATATETAAVSPAVEVTEVEAPVVQEAATAAAPIGVLGVQYTRTPAEVAAAAAGLPTQATPTSGSALARTGFAAALLTAIAAGAIALGVAVRRLALIRG